MDDYNVEELNAYIYTKGERKKVANNVVLLLSHSLKEKIVLTDAEKMGPGKHLLWCSTIVAAKTKAI